jgi:hypothetical protein
MGIITKKLYEGKIDFPEKDSLIIIEDNIGDDLPIHIHLGLGAPGRCNIRLHFTYKEFKKFCIGIINGGKR